MPRCGGQGNVISFNLDMGKKRKFIHLNSDKNECFALRICIIYLLFLLERETVLDKKYLNVMAWVLGHKFDKIRKQLFGILSPKEKEEKREAFSNVTDTEGCIDLIHPILYKAGKKRITDFLQIIRETLFLRHKSLAYRGKCDMEKKMTNMTKMLNLSNNEIKFFMFLYIITAWENAEEYFINHLKCNAISGRRYLKTVLQMTDDEINAVLSGTLMKTGYCEIKQFSFCVNDDFKQYFLKPLNKTAEFKYFKPIIRKNIELSNPLIDPPKTDYILKLLSAKKKSPTHILLHGDADSGKKSYAYELVKKLEIPAYEITQNSDETVKQGTAITACLNITNTNEGSVIIVDNADNILRTKDTLLELIDPPDKNLLGSVLEEPGAKIIWITNSIEDINSSVLEHFSFSLHFNPLSRQQRIDEWKSVMHSHHLNNSFNDDELAELSTSYPVNTATVDLCIKKSLEITSPAQDNFKEVVRMNLDAHLELTKQKNKSLNKNKIEDNYSIEGLNVEGDLPRMLQQLEAFNRYMRRSDKSLNCNLNLLFYGPPGTGKSELARYIAKHLEREIICQRASDIVHPYMGETEQNMKKVFSRAEAEKAILIIDEVDSFLFNRKRSIRSWEISQTNEFLTQMERFRGILICSTNMMEGLDSASLRRFNQKIKFNYLKPDGNIIFYQRFLKPLTNSPLDENMKNVLSGIKQLTPGDFQLIRDRYSFYPPQEINHQVLVEALSNESNIKQYQKSCGMRIGF